MTAGEAESPAEEQQNRSELLIVSGMSGAGRSTVANALEDLGWFVVDNLPPQMLDPLVKIIETASASFPRLAVVIDIRGRALFSQIEAQLDQLRSSGVPVRLVFLEASDEVLVRRFEQVRRPHPLQGRGTILDGILTERARLRSIRERADEIIDTSDMNVHELSSRVTDLFGEAGAARLQVMVMSFGFKYGIPLDADMVADMRFLPNPFWVPELRPLTGLDEPVRDYVLQQSGADAFLDSYAAAARIVLAGYEKENKHHAVIAVGCTGGKHRSVAMTEALAARLKGLDGVAVLVKHRDLGKE